MEDAPSAYESTGPVTGAQLLRMPWLNPCELVEDVLPGFELPVDDVFE